MSKLSKCYKKWWPAIWAIIISVIVVVLILFCTNIYGKEYPDKIKHKTDKIERQDLKEVQNVLGKEYRERLDALFTKWDSILDEEHKEIGTTLRTIATSLSIWIGLIAAICTILPIILGINTNLNFRNDMAHAEKRMLEKSMDNARNTKKDIEATKNETEKQLKEIKKRTEREIKKSIKKSEANIKNITANTERKLNELEKTIENGKKSSELLQINQILSDLSVHMRVISELQEFDSHDKATLTKPSLLTRVLKNLVAELYHVKENIQQDNNEETTFVSTLLVLCMLKRLLTAVESSFKDYNLLTLQKLRSKIDNEITNKMKVPKGEADNKELISLSYDYAVEIEKLFEDFIEENNLEQKDKK